MIDQRIVGAIIRGDLSEYSLTADDARLIARQYIATPVASLLRDFPDAASPEAREILQAASDKATLNSLLLARTANDVSRILESAEIPALVYKGVALAAGALGSWRGRESVDVDVLVAPATLDAVHEAFVSHGLVRADREAEPPSRAMRYYGIEVAYRGLPKTVDLHWRLEAPGYLDLPFERIWAGRQRLNTAGVRIWTPATEVSVLVSAVHGSRERWRSLKHMLDFSASISAMTPEQWEAVANASAHGSAKSLAVGLGVAELCGTPQMPATTNAWGQKLAWAFIDEWARAAGSASFRTDRPMDAMRRRLQRWQMAPHPRAALDGFMRSAARQPFTKRSWSFQGSAK